MYTLTRKENTFMFNSRKQKAPPPPGHDKKAAAVGTPLIS
jgi:hypothetical protein